MKPSIEEQARRVYWSYVLRVNGPLDPEWEERLLSGEFDRHHGVRIALEALRSTDLKEKV